MVLDVLIVVFIIAGVGFGLWRGLVSQGLAILGIYLGALLGRFAYEPVARSIASVVSLDVRVVELLVFLVIIVAVAILVLVAAHTLWGSLKLPYRWGQVDLVGGMLLGAVVGVLAAMFLVLGFGFVVTTAHLSGSAANYPLFNQVQATWSASLLRGPVVQIGHVLYYALLPGAGTTSPDILRVFAPR